MRCCVEPLTSPSCVCVCPVDSTNCRVQFILLLLAPFFISPPFLLISLSHSLGSPFSICWRSRDREWSCSSRYNILLSPSSRVTTFPIFLICTFYAPRAVCMFLFRSDFFSSRPALKGALMMNWSCGVVGWTKGRLQTTGRWWKGSIILTYSTTDGGRLTTGFGAPPGNQQNADARWKSCYMFRQWASKTAQVLQLLLISWRFSHGLAGSINMKSRIFVQILRS